MLGKQGYGRHNRGKQNSRSRNKRIIARIRNGIFSARHFHEEIEPQRGKRLHRPVLAAVERIEMPVIREERGNRHDNVRNHRRKNGRQNHVPQFLQRRHVFQLSVFQNVFRNAAHRRKVNNQPVREIHPHTENQYGVKAGRFRAVQKQQIRIVEQHRKSFLYQRARAHDKYNAGNNIRQKQNHFERAGTGYFLEYHVRHHNLQRHSYQQSAQKLNRRIFNQQRHFAAYEKRPEHLGKRLHRKVIRAVFAVVFLKRKLHGIRRNAHVKNQTLRHGEKKEEEQKQVLSQFFIVNFFIIVIIKIRIDLLDFFVY